MFSRCITRSATRVPIPKSAVSSSFTPVAAAVARQTRLPNTCFEGRRYISAYGYTQAKALVYSKYGEPKDVLQ
jgi:trans-2-enoyl-CoA reductase